MGLLLSWLGMAVSVWLTAAVLPGFHLRDFKGAIIVAAIFGVLNALVGWLLFFALGVATLGLGFVFTWFARWVVNTVLLMVTDAMSDSLRIDGIKVAAIGAAIMSLLGTVGTTVVQILT